MRHRAKKWWWGCATFIRKGVPQDVGYREGTRICGSGSKGR